MNSRQVCLSAKICFSSTQANIQVVNSRVKYQAYGFIFCGFTTASLDCSKTYESDPDAFVYSLTNKRNQCKMKIHSDQNAIYCYQKYDTCIYSNANTSNSRYSSFISFYQHHHQYNSQSFFAGSYQFLLHPLY